MLINVTLLIINTYIIKYIIIVYFLNTHFKYIFFNTCRTTGSFVNNSIDFDNNSYNNVYVTRIGPALFTGYKSEEM